MRSRLRKRTLGIIAILLWIGLASVFAIELLRRSAWSHEPLVDSLTTYQGSVESVHGCFGSRGDRFVIATLRDSKTVKAIELPCTKEFIEMPLGTRLSVRARKVTSLLSPERDDVWDVRSESRVFLDFKERTSRRSSFLSITLQVLTAVALLAGLVLLTIVLRAARKEANEA